jgi:quinol monooxygenase YgiN
VAEEMDVIHTTLRMVIPRERSGEVLQILNPMAERVRLEPGCLACNIYRDVQDPRVIMLEQVWRCPTEMGRHLRSEQYRNVLLVMEMALEPPEVRFNEVSKSTGVETIEKARLGTEDV